MNKIVQSIKQKHTKINMNNYCKFTVHNADELFQDKKYLFKINKYTHYLYMDRKECEFFLHDYLKFVYEVYHKTVFSISHFNSVVSSFLKFLEYHNVYCYYQTSYGLKILNTKEYNLVDTIKSMLQIDCVDNVPHHTQIALLGQLTLNPNYYLDFFNHLSFKIESDVQCQSYDIERLDDLDLQLIKDYYNDKVSSDKFTNTPFYLNKTRAEYEVVKKIMTDYILPQEEDQYIWIASNNLTKKISCIAKVIVDKNKKAQMYIVTNPATLDGKLHEIIYQIKSYVINKLGVSTIIGHNINQDISFSSCSTAYMLSGFSTNLDGLKNDTFGISSFISKDIDESNREAFKVKFDILKDVVILSTY